MAIHRKFYENGEIQSLLETKILVYESGTVEIEYHADYSSEGFLECSVETDQYYSLDHELYKEMETRKTDNKDSQKVILYSSNGEISSRMFYESAPFEYSEEYTKYQEDGSLKERKTVVMETDPVCFSKRDKTNDRLFPVGNIKSTTTRRNIYDHGKLILRYGKEQSEEKCLEVYTEYGEDGQVLFIEKSEQKREQLSEHEFIEHTKCENTEGLSLQTAIFEEQRGNTIERLNLDTEEIETQEYGEHYAFFSVSKHKTLRWSNKEYYSWEDDIKHVETTEVIYQPDGIILRKKYIKIYYNESGIIDMISLKEVQESKGKLIQTRVTKEYGDHIGEYTEQRVVLCFEDDHLASCESETFYDPDHLMGILEHTKEAPENVENVHQLKTVRKVLCFENCSDESSESSLPAILSYFIHP